MGIESFLYMGPGIGKTAALKKFGIELQVDSEEMIDTTALDDEPVCYPDNEETRETFKDVFKVEIPEEEFEKLKDKSFIRSLRFHHDVYDKDGHKEMEILYNPDARPHKFAVHYPRFEISGAKLRDCTCFQGFTREQIGMVVFAYSEEEYWKFEKAFLEWSGKINERDGETV